MADCKVNYSPTNYLTQEPVTIWNGHSSDQYVGNIIWSFATTGAPIPDGGTYTADKFQWLHSSYEKTVTVGTAVLGIDDRSRDFNNVQYKFDLTAGTYKLIFEAIDPSGTWNSDRLARYSSSSGYYGTPDFGIYTSSGAVITPISFDKTKYQGKTFIHEEYEFTMSSDRKVGLWFRGMGHADSTINGFMPRFMIVPTDTKTKKFDVTSNNVNYSGYSCWSGLYHSLRKLTTATEAVENPLYSDGTAITAYTIKGNEEHTGTPSPSNPVMPNGVGDRTENLFDESTIQIGGLNYQTGAEVPDDNRRRSGFIAVNSDTYYSISRQLAQTSPSNFWILGYDENKNPITDGIFSSSPCTIVAMGGDVASASFWCTETTKYIRWYVTANNSYSNLMLNAGSTAKPYEPYGFKIPILNGQTALTPVYLTEPLMKISSMNDELNSNNILLRKIRKMVCNGSENWNVYSAGTSVSFFYLSVSANKGIDTVIMCTHYERKGIDTVTSTVGIDLVSDGTIMRLRPQNVASDFPDLNSWTTYLQQQYENGTPVTIWYALNTATTETVTVPSIPTTEGANSITVDTTVQPSEFLATWTGWHNAYVKESTALLTSNPLCGLDTYKDTLNLATGECTRKVRKYVVTGQENWQKSGRYIGSFYCYDLGQGGVITTAICTHAEYTVIGDSTYHYGTFALEGTTQNKTLDLYLGEADWSADDFKAYLQQQYAAGTPVTVWFVRATPITETITVPSGLSGTEEGYLTQSGTPTPSNPIYPTANEVDIWQ